MVLGSAFSRLSRCVFLPPVRPYLLINTSDSGNSWVSNKKKRKRPEDMQARMKAAAGELMAKMA